MQNLFRAFFPLGIYVALCYVMGKDNKENKTNVEKMDDLSKWLIGIYLAICGVCSGLIGTDNFFRIIRKIFAEHKVGCMIAGAALMFSVLLPIVSLLSNFNIFRRQNISEKETESRKIIYNLASSMLFLLVVSIFSIMVISVWG